MLRAVVCGPCWAAHGGRPAAGEIGPVPGHTVPIAYPSGQAQWLRELAEQSWVQAIRADGQRNLMAIARTVMEWASWETCESRPTWAELMRASGLSIRSVARWLLELRLRGWLELLEHGSTPETRPMSLAHVEGNRAALYGLRMPLTPQRAQAVAAELLMTELATELEQLAMRPGMGEGPGDPAAGAHAADQLELSPVEINGTPSWSLRSLTKRSSSGTSRARKPVDKSRSIPPDQGKYEMTALRAGPEEGPVPDLLIMVPVSGYSMLACAEELRRRRPAVFGRCSRRLVRALCRPYWRAGWCNRDVLHALDYRPSMFAPMTRALAMPTEQLASPRQLILGRLRAWRDSRGVIRPGYWTTQLARTATDDTNVAGAGNPTGDSSRARQLVRARHGHAGARLLRAGEQTLTPERVAAHGRAARAASNPLPRATDGAVAPIDQTATAQQRAARDRLRAELVGKARALAATSADSRPTSDRAAGESMTSASTAAADLPLSAYERAVLRARGEGHIRRHRDRRS